MLIRDLVKKRRWPYGICGIAIAVFVLCIWKRWTTGEWPGGSSPIGLSLGIVGGLIIFFEFAIWPRKFFRSVQWGCSAQWWLRAHIWFGLLSLPLAWLHSGAGPTLDFGGWFTFVLMWTFLVVIASGIYGLWLQQFLPRLLLEEIPEETIYSQIDHVSQRHAWDADDMVLAVCGPDPEERWKKKFPDRGERGEAGGVISKLRRVGSVRGTVLEAKRATGTLIDGKLLRDAFYNEIADYLLHGSRSYLLDGRRTKSKLVDFSYAARYFADLGGKVEPEARDTVEALEELCEQRRQFDRQARIHRWLHGWLWIHAPLSAALVVLLLIHIVTALKYL